MYVELDSLIINSPACLILIFLPSLPPSLAPSLPPSLLQSGLDDVDMVLVGNKCDLVNDVEVPEDLPKEASQTFQT